VGDPDPIHMSELSAFRPCGCDLVEFFNSAGWAFFVQVAVPMRLLMLADFAGVISHMMISGQCDKRTLLGAFLAEVVLI
jgi:heme exporter protein D